MDFDNAKENIQPLASGRNAQRLEAAINAESDHEIQEKLLKQRHEFEKAIEEYKGDDPLDLWYEYIQWVEQSYPKSGKETALNELITKCLAVFEGEQHYQQDRRLIKMYIKYIDQQQNPNEYYELLYNNGIGTMVADFYLCWAHYYDYCDNFEKAESVYQKGLSARAQPLELIEQAHKQFYLSMSQRLLHRDASTRQKFLSSMEEQRLALTSLRAYKHRHVGSIRTGSVVKSLNPGQVSQSVASSATSNRRVEVFNDENHPINEQAAGGSVASTSPVASTSTEPHQMSVVQVLLSASKKQENMREPGPWSNVKVKLARSVPIDSTSSRKLPFDIAKDDDLIPLSDADNMYAKGIQLPPGFAPRNAPQTEFIVPLHRDDEHKPNSKPAYDKFMLFPNEKQCFSSEELLAYKWFKKRQIHNSFVDEMDAVWECGADIPIRLPPFFKRKNDPQTEMQLSRFDPLESLASGNHQFSFNINLIYPKNGEENSPDEILQAKWLNGDLPSQRANEMELTYAFNRRESIFISNANRRSIAVGGRKSILPKNADMPRKSILRKSIAPPPVQEDLVEETQDDDEGAMPMQTMKRKTLTKELVQREKDAEISSPPCSRQKLQHNEEDSTAAATTSEVSTVKFNIFQDIEQSKKLDKNVFKTPKLPPMKPRASTTFAMDDDGDGCTTQTFNFFLKSQSVSTPKVNDPQMPIAMSTATSATQPRKLSFSLTDTTVYVPPTVQEDVEATATEEIEEKSTEIARLPFAVREHETSRERDANYHQTEIDYGRPHVLSAILETTEDTNTISSAATITASSKSSSADEFDYTKQTTSHCTTIASTHRTQVNDTSTRSMANKTASTPPTVVETKNVDVTLSKANQTVEESEMNMPTENTRKPIPFGIFVDDVPASSQSPAADMSVFKIPESETVELQNLLNGLDSIAPRSIQKAVENSIVVPKNSRSIFGQFEEQTITCPLVFSEERTENIPPTPSNRTAQFNYVEERTEPIPIPSILTGRNQTLNASIAPPPIEIAEPTIEIPIFAPKVNDSMAISFYGKPQEKQETLSLSKFISNEDKTRGDVKPSTSFFALPDEKSSRSFLVSPEEKQKASVTSTTAASNRFSIFVDENAGNKSIAPKSTATESLEADYERLFTSFGSANSSKSAKAPEPQAASALIQTKQLHDIEDEFYDMIKSPAMKSVNTSKFAKNKSQMDKPKNLGEPIDSTLSLLEPMKDVSIRAPAIPAEMSFNFSDEVPNTQMFSMDLKSIKNSTIIGSQVQSNISLVANQTKKSNRGSAESSLIEKAATTRQQVIANSNVFDLSGVEMTEAERCLFGSASNSESNSASALISTSTSVLKNDSFPKILISQPKTIRPSQYNRMTCGFVNETATSRNATLAVTAMDQNDKLGEIDDSVFIVEPTQDIAAVVAQQNETVREYKSAVNPFDVATRNRFLSEIDFVDYISNLENVYVGHSGKVIQPNSEIAFGDQQFRIHEVVARGSFGYVYSGECLKTGKKYALKQESPANLWELYISLETHARIEDPDILAAMLSIDYAIIGKDASVMVSQFSNYGSLVNVFNRHKTVTQQYIDESIVMILANQMLKIIDHLHAANIIHADIKPDNFLLMRRLRRSHDDIVLKLIDFGQAIDLNFFERDQAFTTKIETTNFICTEMMENKPWKFQLDLFCLASTIYTLLTGKYMNVKKTSLSGFGNYTLSDPLPANFEELLWMNIFHTLINIRNCNSMPDLQGLRLSLREAIECQESSIEEKVKQFNLAIARNP